MRGKKRQEWQLQSFCKAQTQKAQSQKHEKLKKREMEHLGFIRVELSWDLGI